VKSDAERLRSTLGAPELAWLIDRLHRRLELGRDLTGAAVLNDASAEERRAVARLLGRTPRPGKALSIPLELLEARLRNAGIAPDLKAAVETLRGPVENRRDRADAETAERDRLRALRNTSHHKGLTWYESWSAAIDADGTATRLIRSGSADTIAHAVAVLDRLPVVDLPIPVLAEAATGDTKALTGTGLERLVLRAVAAWRDRPAPANRVEARELWAEVGVIVDDLSSQVLVLNPRVREHHLLGNWLDAAADDGLPVRLTLHQLLRYPSTPDLADLYVCENPAVMRTAASELGADCAPLLCTEGEPFHASLRFVAAAAEAGSRIHWRGDFDWTGARTTAAAIDRWGAVPWRMGATDYLEALALGESEPLKGRPVPTTWDSALAAAMSAHGTAVMEERLIPKLLEDLSGMR
jgi:uncharacterized protein (TIGR02679 family)